MLRLHLLSKLRLWEIKEAESPAQISINLGTPDRRRWDYSLSAEAERRVLGARYLMT
jgi:hypothetical protein